MTTFYNTTFCLSEGTISRLGATTGGATCVEIGKPIYAGSASLENQIKIWVNGDHSKAQRIVDAINAAMRDDADAEQSPPDGSVEVHFSESQNLRAAE